MNYPFRTAALAWLRGGDASDFRRDMEEIRENYPPAAFHSGLNILGTHDTPRLLTMLGAARTPESKDDRATYRLSRRSWTWGWPSAAGCAAAVQLPRLPHGVLRR